VLGVRGGRRGEGNVVLSVVVKADRPAEALEARESQPEVEVSGGRGRAVWCGYRKDRL